MTARNKNAKILEKFVTNKLNSGNGWLKVVEMHTNQWEDMKIREKYVTNTWKYVKKICKNQRKVFQYKYAWSHIQDI